MTRKTRYLRRRNNTYFFRQRIPNDLLNYFSGTELTYSLPTFDPIVATTLAKHCAVAAERMFRCVRMDKTLDQDSVAKLARTFFVDALEQAEAEISELTGGRAEDAEIFADLNLDEAKEWAGRLQRNHLRRAEIVAKPFLDERGIEIADGNPLSRRFLRMIARAMVEISYIKSCRLRGDYRVAPEDPLFVGALNVHGTDHVTAETDASHDVSLSRLFDAWRNERQVKPKTLIEWQTAFRMFYEIVGDKPVRQIGKEDIRLYKDTLLRLPSSMSKKYRGRSVPDVLDTIDDDPAIPRLKAASVNKYLTALGTVFAYAETNGYAEQNPTVGMKVPLPKTNSNKRVPYSVDDLHTIFSWPVWTGCSSAARPKNPGTYIYQNANYWLPLLALFSGCRLEELGQAYADDIRLDDGVMVLDINDDDDKTLKAASSRRLMPIHPELRKCGFLDYATDMQNSGHTRLFPDLRPDRNGIITAGWSKWWGRYQRGMGLTDERKVFHSFRHGFRDTLRNAGIPVDLADTLMGHANPTMGGRYGRGHTVTALAQAIQKVDYSGLDLSHLYPE